MSKADLLMGRLLAADRFTRADLLLQIERDFGAGFASTLRDQLDSHDLSASNEAAAKSASRHYRSKKAARTRARRRGA